MGSANVPAGLLAGNSGQSCFRLLTLDCQLLGRNLFPRMRTIVAPLFSHTYKTLFPQVLSFDIHTKPRGVYPLHVLVDRDFRSPDKPNLFCFTLLRALLLPAGIQVPCFHSLARSFAKTPGVGGVKSKNIAPRDRIFGSATLPLRHSSPARQPGTTSPGSRNSPPEMNAVTRKKWYSARSVRPARSTPLGQAALNIRRNPGEDAACVQNRQSALRPRRRAQGKEVFSHEPSCCKHRQYHAKI